MSLCVLGMHEEFKPFGIGVNALWPGKSKNFNLFLLKYFTLFIVVVHTAATDMLAGDLAKSYSRKPDIMADAAYAILIQNPKVVTGNFFIDEDVLRKSGVSDIDQYACDLANKDDILPDFFCGDPETFEDVRGPKHKL